ncbi:MAG TPA: DUF350 domain-containing protein [Alicyclobacillus sp.]|nr:DUF350 domain-containing protein [Alicyclobacillus sp.]
MTLTIHQLLTMGFWFVLFILLLVILMAVDVALTQYNDFELIRRGHTAVALRFVLKLLAHALIISRSMMISQVVWDAVVISAYAFVLLLIVQWLFDLVMKRAAGIDMSKNIAENHTPSALLSGSLHVVGAVILMGSM